MIANRYLYHFTTEYEDTYLTRIIVGDTIINNKTYFVHNEVPFYNCLPFIRIEGKQMYAFIYWSSWFEIPYLNFDAQIGDTSWYYWYRTDGIVKNVKEKIVFGEKQKVWTIVPCQQPEKGDSIVYSTKFGELGFYYDGKKRLELVGAIICNHRYGAMK
ncbi:MAG: hypothetical protein Kow0042_08120 [Calditrichia bacterium]